MNKQDEVDKPGLIEEHKVKIMMRVTNSQM